MKKVGKMIKKTNIHFSLLPDYECIEINCLRFLMAQLKPSDSHAFHVKIDLVTQYALLFQIPFVLYFVIVTSRLAKIVKKSDFALTDPDM